MDFDLKDIAGVSAFCREIGWRRGHLTLALYLQSGPMLAGAGMAYAADATITRVPT